MLFDPKWEVQTKPDVFSLESLIAWLETMPALTPYCYADTGGCLLHKYFTAMGLQNVSVGGGEMSHSGCRYVELSDDFSDVACDHPRTFGAALTRARAALR